jgi:hypothetical protein
MNRIELEALMKANPDDRMLYDGKMMPISEILGRLFRGDSVEVIPAAPAPGQPGHQAGPNLRISQAAVDALSEAQYNELKETGHLRGLTNSDRDRAMVHVSQGGSYTSRLSFDPETGKVGPGRPMDLSLFDDPAAGSK